jgi:hypothetical protein
MQQASFILSGILTNAFEFQPEHYLPGQKVGVDMGVRFGLEEEARKLITRFQVSYHHEKTNFIHLEVSMAFQIDQDLWDSLQQEGKMIVPRNSALQLGRLCMDTARGVLHTKTEGHELNAFHLPLLNISAAVPQDVVIEMS